MILPIVGMVKETSHEESDIVLVFVSGFIPCRLSWQGPCLPDTVGCARNVVRRFPEMAITKGCQGRA